MITQDLKLPDLEPNPRVKVAILNKLANDYINTRFELQAVYKLNKVAGLTDDQQKDVLARLALCEKVLAVLDEDIKKISEGLEANNG